MAVTKRLRYEILRRDNHACRYCGATAPDATLTVDHVVPVALGGSDDPTNLVTACRDCNAGKSSAAAHPEVVADVDQDAIRWAAAIKRAAELADIDRDARMEVEKAVYAVFSDVPVPSYRGGGTVAEYLPGDWFASVERFMQAGLGEGEMVDAAYIATARKVKAEDIWRYFCGICWRKADQRQDAARALIESETAATSERSHGHSREYMDGAETAWYGMRIRYGYAIDQYEALTAVTDGGA